MAKAKKQKAEVKAPETWDAVQCSMELYAKKKAALDAQQAAMDDALLKVRTSYLGDMNKIENEMADIEASLEAFGREHKAEFKAAPDGDGRSFAHAAVTIGFRKMPPVVKLPHRKADQEAALSYLKIYRDGLIRLTPEFDKPAILSELQEGNRVTVEALAEHGIKLDPGKDEFFVRTEGA